MKMFVRASLLSSLSLAGTIGCSASVGGFGGSGGSGQQGSGGAATGAGGTTFGTGGTTFGTGGTTFGTGGTTFGTGGTTFGSGGTAAGVGGTAAGAGGTTAGTGGGDAGPGCTATAFTVTNDSYIDNGTFCGYAWTAAYESGGATIEPPCPSAGGSCFMGDICATAVIPANEAPDTYPGVMIGWNVAQKSTGGTEGTFAGTFASITPTFTTTGVTGEVRLVLQSGNTDYCASATSGTPISRASFAKDCWDTATAVPIPAGTPIKTVLLQVNGADAAQPSVEFCLTGLTVQ